MTPAPEQAGREDLAVRLEGIAIALQHEVSRLGGLHSGAELERLKDEIRAMGQLIAETRAEVAGLLPPGVAGSRLASASTELDAVVGATERAAVEIMVAAERSQEAARHLRAAALPADALREVDAVEAAVTDIFVACSFQDITGQRIRKVVQALTYIEQRVAALTALWAGGAGADQARPFDVRADAHLLNGPGQGLAQSDVDAVLEGAEAGGAVSQDDIDALFA